jgi:NADPH:quinone reductase
MKSFWIDGDTMELVPRDVPEPALKPDGVLVKMRAVALNRGEFVSGYGLHAPGSVKTAGYEGAGEIIAVGANVKDLRIGDRVFGRADAAFAEIASMQAGEANRMPAAFDWQTAAGAGITYITAYDALIVEGLCVSGDWALVPAASSGVGVAAIQICKALGFKSFGTTGSVQKLERLKAIGMDAGVPSRAPTFAPLVRDATGGRGAKVSVNNVGGTVVTESLRSLCYRGTLVIVGYVDRMVTPEMDLLAVHINRLRIIGVSQKLRSPAERAETTQGFRDVVLPHMVSGAIRPVVDRVFEFKDLPAAKRYMETDGHIGKIVAVL